jgi:hypothetical protein
MSDRRESSVRTAPPRRRGMWGLLMGWLALVVIVIGGMFMARQETLATMSTPEAQAEWDAWRESEVNQRDDLPVKRRPPKSPEPPALVLMRDHFPVLLGAAVVFGSLLYAALVFAVGGALRTNVDLGKVEPRTTPRNVGG